MTDQEYKMLTISEHRKLKDAKIHIQTRYICPAPWELQ